MSDRRLVWSPYIIVCSYGPLGRAVVTALREAEVSFAVVESATDEVRELRREGVPHVVGSVTRESVLRRVGIDEATAVVCTAPSMVRNARAVELVRRLRGDVRIVARTDETEDGRALLARAGADDVLSPDTEAGKHMATLVRSVRDGSVPGRT